MTTFAMRVMNGALCYFHQRLFDFLSYSIVSGGGAQGVFDFLGRAYEGWMTFASNCMP